MSKHTRHYKHTPAHDVRILLGVATGALAFGTALMRFIDQQERNQRNSEKRDGVEPQPTLTQEAKQFLTGITDEIRGWFK